MVQRVSSRLPPGPSSIVEWLTGTAIAAGVAELESSNAPSTIAADRTQTAISANVVFLEATVTRRLF